MLNLDKNWIDLASMLQYSNNDLFWQRPVANPST